MTTAASAQLHPRIAALRTSLSHLKARAVTSSGSNDMIELTEDELTRIEELYAPGVRKLGLSLSFCVSEIVQGYVPIKDVACLVVGTALPPDIDWDIPLRNYRETYWRKNPDEAMSVVKALRESGRIFQPRLQGHEPPNLIYGFWSAIPDGILPSMESIISYALEKYCVQPR